MKRLLALSCLAIVAAVASVGLGACSSGSATDEGNGGGANRVTSTTTTGAAKLNGFAECEFPPGGLVSKVRLATVGANLTVSWDTPGEAVVGESLLLSVNLGPGTYQIGMKHVGADLLRFVFDVGTSKQTNLTGAYTDTQTQQSVVVPLSLLSKTAAPVNWNAAVTMDGNDVARCPASGTATFGSSP